MAFILPNFAARTTMPGGIGVYEYSELGSGAIVVANALRPSTMSDGGHGARLADSTALQDSEGITFDEAQARLRALNPGRG